jgi:hypothetical protein
MGIAAPSQSFCSICSKPEPFKLCLTFNQAAEALNHISHTTAQTTLFSNNARIHGSWVLPVYQNLRRQLYDMIEMVSNMSFQVQFLPPGGMPVNRQRSLARSSRDETAISPGECISRTRATSCRSPGSLPKDYVLT